MADLWMFIAALVLAYLVPGPDMLLVVHVGAERGRAHALAAAAGLAVARGAHVGFAAVGLAAILAAMPVALTLLRLAGAVYLAWFAIGLLRASSLSQPSESHAHGAAFRRGLVTNLLNPKALLFCSVLLPQFTDPVRGPVAGQFLLLGMMLVAVGFAFDLVYTLSGRALENWVSAHPRFQRRIFAALMGAFALHLAWVAIAA